MRRRHVLTGLAALGASSDRTIVLAFIDVDYRIRLEPASHPIWTSAISLAAAPPFVRLVGAIILGKTNLDVGGRLIQP